MNLEACKTGDGVYEVDIAVVARPKSIYVSLVPQQFDAPPEWTNIHHSPDKSTSTHMIALKVGSLFERELGTAFREAVISDDGVPLPESLNVKLDAGRSYLVRLQEKRHG